MNVVQFDKVNITSSDILKKEVKSFMSFIKEKKGNCLDAEYAQQCYFLSMGTAGQLVLAAEEMNNKRYAKKIRGVINELNIEYFIKNERRCR